MQRGGTGSTGMVNVHEAELTLLEVSPRCYHQTPARSNLTRLFFVSSGAGQQLFQLITCGTSNLM